MCANALHNLSKELRILCGIALGVTHMNMNDCGPCLIAFNCGLNNLLWGHGQMGLLRPGYFCTNHGCCNHYWLYGRPPFSKPMLPALYHCTYQHHCLSRDFLHMAVTNVYYLVILCSTLLLLTR